MARAVDVISVTTHRGNFLEIKCLDKGEELILSIINRIVNEFVREKNRVVCHLNLLDGLADSDFEFLLCLNSVTDTSAQFFEAGWVNEQEVALKSLSVDLDCTLDVDLKDGNLSIGSDAVQLSKCCTIESTLRSLTVFNELSVLSHSHKFILRNEVEVLEGLLIVGSIGPSCIRLFAVENVTVLLKDKVNQGAFTNTGWSNKDQWLIFEWCWIEWVEVLLGIDEYIIL